MTVKNPVSLVIVGSIGLDTVATPLERREEVLGGSVSFACAAASFFCKTGMVGVVGDDFPAAYAALYGHFGIDLSGLQRVPGKTFRWEGEYANDMNDRRTLRTELNVFAEFAPTLPASYRSSPFLFLANISPDLQTHVLGEMTAPKFVAADTMDLWINTARPALERVIRSVHMLTLNDSEARMLSGEHNLVKAAACVRAMGPTYLVIKKGEHGAMLFGPGGVFIVPAFPLESVLDPTGAGDTFAGGMMGALAALGRTDEAAMRLAMVYGSVVASFGVERFSLDRLAALTRGEIEARTAAFRKMITLEA
ncbi:MAG: PfkB family carbohydrate kinase [bacterium]